MLPPFHCRPKPKICHLKPVTCCPAQVSSRHVPVTNCRPEPACIVTDIPKRDIAAYHLAVGRCRQLMAFYEDARGDQKVRDKVLLNRIASTDCNKKS